MKDNFYKELTKDEKELCDSCRDWNLEECERCEFVSRFSYKNKQEVNTYV